MVKIYGDNKFQRHTGELDIPAILNDYNTNTKLTSFCISDSKITLDQCTELSRIFNVPNLSSFYINTTLLEDDECVKNLFGNDNLKSSAVQFFEIGTGCKLTRNGLNTIVNYLPKILQKVILECSDITENDVSNIFKNIANDQRLVIQVYLYSNGKRYQYQCNNEDVLGSVNNESLLSEKDRKNLLSGDGGRVVLSPDGKEFCDVWG